MMTVGRGIFHLSPVAAFVCVIAHAIVLFLFASQDLEHFLISQNLPPIPLVPVSSSQAIVGAVIGIGLLKGRGRGIRWKTVAGTMSGWIIAPIIAALLSFISMFFLQNVFQQETYRPVAYLVTSDVAKRIQDKGVSIAGLEKVQLQEFATAVKFNKALSEHMDITSSERDIIMASAELDEMEVTSTGIAELDINWITPSQIAGLQSLEGRIFEHKWQLNDALAEASMSWRPVKGDDKRNEEIKQKLAYIYRYFRVGE
jgi:PiT family inorganic phosphate transporter